MHKIRHMNKILSVFLCVVVLFCAFCAPFTVNAVVGVDDAIYLTIATICLSLGASIAFNNPNTGEEILNYAQNIWNHIDPFTQTIIRNKIVNFGGAVPIYNIGMYYSYYANWSTSEWQKIGSDIISYFNNSGSGSTDPTYKSLTVTPNKSGKIGFTSDSLFSFDLPNNAVENDIYHVSLGRDSYFDFGRVDRSILSTMYPAMGIPSNNANYPYYYSRIFNSSGFGQVICYETYTGKLWQAATFDSTLCDWSDATHPDQYVVGFVKKGVVFFLDYHSHGSSYPGRKVLWYDYDGNTYNLTTFTTETGGARYAFISTSDSSHYMGLDFPNYHRAICWFAQTCGLAMPNSEYVPDDYVANPSDSDDVINLDTSKATTNLNNQISTAVDDTINTVIAGNIDDLKILADDPTLITNPTAAADVIVVYPSDLPSINASGNFWTTKFPFCLPWDIYNLIVGFSATQEAPSLHFLVFPADSFGIGVPDTYIDINFADYYQAVQIFRFFIKIEFVLALILVTKRLIK